MNLGCPDGRNNQAGEAGTDGGTGSQSPQTIHESTGQPAIHPASQSVGLPASVFIKRRAAL